MSFLLLIAYIGQMIIINYKRCFYSFLSTNVIEAYLKDYIIKIKMSSIISSMTHLSYILLSFEVGMHLMIAGILINIAVVGCSLCVVLCKHWLTF